MEITISAYLKTLKDIKSFIKGTNSVIRNEAFWPKIHFSNIAHFKNSIGNNPTGYFVFLQSNNIKIPIIRSHEDKTVPYRAITAIDRAIFGQRIVLCIDKRNGSCMICHTYEDENGRNPIKPLNEAIRDIEQALEEKKIPLDYPIKLNGLYKNSNKWSIYRVAETNNDLKSFPVAVMNGYTDDENKYGKRLVDTKTAIHLLEEVEQKIKIYSEK